MSSYVYYGIMVVGVVLALVGLSKQKQGATWGQPLAIVGAILAIVCVLLNAVKQSGQGGAVDREHRFMMLEHKFLGEYIAKQNPKKVAVLVDPMTHFDVWGEPLATPTENVALEGLKAGLGGVEVVEIYPTVPKSKKPAPMKDSQGHEFEPIPAMPFQMMTPKDFAACLTKAQGCDVFVSLYMLPPEMKLAQALALLKGKKVALANAGFLDQLGAIFADAGKTVAELIAVVTTKQSAVYDDSIPAGDQAAFDKRYILITKENYTQAIEEAKKPGKN